MTDRRVRQILPVPDDETSNFRPFSSFTSCPNIILLGDPGAGKTHLFKEAAPASGGRVLKARDFLNIPQFDGNPILFIDALDEKRAGRGDQDTIDQIVRKLFDVRPKKARISCRAPDWLGETDFAAFQPYFDSSGGAVVLGLDVLSEQERRGVLFAQGACEAEIDPFLAEASTRGLEEFLLNPQNLIMLWNAVRSGKWPGSRTEMFELSTSLMLQEPNRFHAQSTLGAFTANELRPVAGAICAARLIGDVEGISLSEFEDGSDYPSFRTIPFFEPNTVRAALGRRVFSASEKTESVDYTHRTTAEFLGASWLAGEVRAGLPLGRVRSLLSNDGHPASELRGLHAWLAVFLPEHADVLINADPYGVLMYGDASSLQPSSRRNLVNALSELALVDPWFRVNNWESPALGSLSGEDMAGEFQRILALKDAPFHLRSLILDAIVAGRPLVALKKDLVEILKDSDAPYSERSRALAALTKMDNDAQAEILRICRDELGTNANSLRLRADIISAFYDYSFDPKDIISLLDDALSCEEKVPTGAFGSIATCVGKSDIPVVLDLFSASVALTRRPQMWTNDWEIRSTTERLLLRALQECGEDINAPKIWKWLRARHKRQADYSYDKSEKLKLELHKRPKLLRAIAEEFFCNLIVDSNVWGEIQEFHAAVLHLIEPDAFLELSFEYFESADIEATKRKFFYELSLTRAFSGTPAAFHYFEKLFTLGDDVPELSEIRDRRLVCPLLDSELKRQQKRITKLQENDRIWAAKTAEFAENTPAIQAGKHLGWLSWVAQIYFGFFSDIDRNLAPVERLNAVIGEVNAGAAIDGFMALLQREDIPPLSTVIEMSVKGRRFDWWLGLIAGIDEFWKRTQNLDSLSDELLRSLLAMELTNITFPEADGAMDKTVRGWKDHIFENRPDLVYETYLALVRAGLSHGLQNINGFHELLNCKTFRPILGEAIAELLRSFPNAHPFRLDELLQCALDIQPARAVLPSLTSAAMARIDLEGVQRDMWLAAGYLASPEQFDQQMATHFSENAGMTWVVRDMIGFERRNKASMRDVSLPQLELLACRIGTHFPDVDHPSNGWSGNTNPWDAADFVRAIVNQISTVSAPEATNVLGRLAQDSGLQSYRERILHNLANQRARCREAEYRQPNWDQTIVALSNGTPANVGDMHAFLITHLVDLGTFISNTNTDVYKQFWNEDSYGRLDSPKTEESCRDVLVTILRPRVSPLGITIEPEGHMARDKRADIAASMPGIKILIELKRDHHADIWHAAETQLDRFYTRDPEAKGFGIYGVFWFGDKRKHKIPLPRRGQPRPQSAAEMKQMLSASIPADKRNRLEVVVIDVSGA